MTESVDLDIPLPIQKRAMILVDMNNNEALAEKINFSARRPPSFTHDDNWKIWIDERSCPGNYVEPHNQIDFDHLVK